MEKNKNLALSFIAVLVLLFVFVIAQIPVAHQSIKNLPIAIVNKDEGEMGKTLIENIQAKTRAKHENSEQIIHWKVLTSERELKEEMNQQNIYGGIMIPTDFSEVYASLQTDDPHSPKLQLFINQGKNALVSDIVGQSLTSMVSQVNEMVSGQILLRMENNEVFLTSDQAMIFMEPIKQETIVINEVGELGQAPQSLF